MLYQIHQLHRSDNLDFFSEIITRRLFSNYPQPHHYLMISNYARDRNLNHNQSVIHPHNANSKVIKFLFMLFIV